MRHIEEVLEEYETDENKMEIITWFQKHPRTRFDVSEVCDVLGDRLEVGQGQVRNYLNALADDDVLERHGEKRIGYQLAGDIIVPVKYRIQHILSHLVAIFDVERWGIASITILVTAMWAVLTIPFWFFWASLVVWPSDSFGPVAQTDLLWMAIATSIWLVIFMSSGIILYRIHRWYR